MPTLTRAFLMSSFNALPMIPKLSKIFSKHKQVQLDAKDHYRWNLNGDFRRLLDIPMMNFWTSIIVALPWTT